MESKAGKPGAGRYAVLVIFALAVAGALYVSLGESRSPAGPADAIYSSVLDQNECVWWTHLGVEGAAVLNLGPILSSKSAAVRRYSLVVHLANSPEPLTCIQGIVPTGDRNAISVQGGSFLVEVFPGPGLGWGDVFSPKQIRATTSGFGDPPPLEGAR